MPPGDGIPCLNDHLMSALDLLNNCTEDDFSVFNLDREIYYVEQENPRQLYKVQRPSTRVTKNLRDNRKVKTSSHINRRTDCLRVIVTSSIFNI